MHSMSIRVGERNLSITRFAMKIVCWNWLLWYLNDWYRLKLNVGPDGMSTHGKKQNYCNLLDDKYRYWQTSRKNGHRTWSRCITIHLSARMSLWWQRRSNIFTWPPAPVVYWYLGGRNERVRLCRIQQAEPHKHSKCTQYKHNSP